MVHCGTCWAIYLPGQSTRTWWLLPVRHDEMHWTCLHRHVIPAMSVEVFKPKPTDKGPSLSCAGLVSLNVWHGNMELDRCRSGKGGVVSREMSASIPEFSLIQSCNKQVSMQTNRAVDYRWLLKSATLVRFWPHCTVGCRGPCKRCLTTGNWHEDGRRPDPSWSRCPGQPWRTWVDQVRDDAGIPLPTLWSTEVARGHGAVQRSSTRRHWWWWYGLWLCFFSELRCNTFQLHHIISVCLQKVFKMCLQLNWFVM